jgi:hypothetical protein
MLGIDGDSRERSMMGRREGGQGQFFYSFDLDKVVPPDHLVRQVEGGLDLSWVHKELAPYYSRTGRPSIDPVLMIRMLIVGYVLQYAWSGGSALRFRSIWRIGGFVSSALRTGFPIIQCFAGPGTSAFAKAMRCAAYLRGVVAKCIAAGLVGGEGFSIDAGLISATSHDLGIGQVERSEALPVNRGLEGKPSPAPITAAVALRFANAVSEKRDGRLACQRYA